MPALAPRRKDPVTVGSGTELRHWMCRMHNRVNQRIGKPQFNCDYVESRWAPLDCGEERSCDLTPMGQKKKK